MKHKQAISGRNKNQPLSIGNLNQPIKEIQYRQFHDLDSVLIPNGIARNGTNGTNLNGKQSSPSQFHDLDSGLIPNGIAGNGINLNGSITCGYLQETRAGDNENTMGLVNNGVVNGVHSNNTSTHVINSNSQLDQQEINRSDACQQIMRRDPMVNGRLVKRHSVNRKITKSMSVNGHIGQIHVRNGKEHIWRQLSQPILTNIQSVRNENVMSSTNVKYKHSNNSHIKNCLESLQDFIFTPKCFLIWVCLGCLIQVRL